MAVIIAEAGINHNGHLNTAKEMIAAAKAAGADIVKFQIGPTELSVSKYAPMADYQKNNTGMDKTQKEMLDEIGDLQEKDWPEVYECCKKTGIKFLCTPYDTWSIKYLTSLGVDALKIPSGEITNYPYLVEAGKTRLPVILSTGMSDIGEVRVAYDVLTQSGTPKITLMHCTSQYPADIADANLNAIVTLKKEFGCDVGYSDHTLGIETAVAAVALGASVIEKHFTLNKTMIGPDHPASAEPDELAALVRAVKNIGQALGDGVKRPKPSEKNTMLVARKSIVAKGAIKKGEVLTEQNITVKRPGNGVNPMRWNQVLGTAAIRDFNDDELIEINF